MLDFIFAWVWELDSGKFRMNENKRYAFDRNSLAQQFYHVVKLFK